MNLSFHFSGIWPFPEEILNPYRHIISLIQPIFIEHLLCAGAILGAEDTAGRDWQRPLPSQVTQNWIIVQITWSPLYSNTYRNGQNSLINDKISTCSHELGQVSNTFSRKMHYLLVKPALPEDEVTSQGARTPCGNSSFRPFSSESPQSYWNEPTMFPFQMAFGSTNTITWINSEQHFLKIFTAHTLSLLILTNHKLLLEIMARLAHFTEEETEVTRG